MSKLPSVRPSFFEVYAAEQLDNALRPAFRYVLEVVSMRNPALLRLANWSDELFSFLLIILETFQLSTEAALLSESFYSLRRSTSFDPNVYNPPLSVRHILSSVVCAVLMPHIRAKLDNWYSLRTGGAAAAMLQELHLSQPLGDERNANSRRTSPSRSARSHSSGAQRTISKLTIALRRLLRLRAVLIRFIEAAPRYLRSDAFKQQVMMYYPKIRTVVDAINMVFGISYLYGHTKYYNLSLALQGLILRRVSATDLLRLSIVALDSSGRPKTTFLHMIGSFFGRIMGVLRIAFFVSIFGFRFLQYYYAAEVR
ncbi:Peroxisome assembly protein [Gracilaria domingensis]|nr:Peroxisome assembly protein [Gracilaria domingensis]